MPKFSGTFFSYVRVALSVLILASVLFYSGFKFGATHPEVVTVKGITNVSDPDVTADFGIFWEAWQKLHEEQIDAPNLKDKDAVYGSISGLAGALKDPYTVFFPPVESKKFQEDIKGSFGGIGAEIGMKNNFLVIIAPLKGSPAEKAGIRAGDKILKVDEKETDGVNVNEAVSLIRGEIGTKVALLIYREGWPKAQTFTITRAEIKVPNLDWKTLPGRIAYLKISSFSENVPQEFYKGIADLLKNEPQGLILDLRNNPGGYLEVAVHLAGWFLEEDTLVVTQRFRNGPDHVSKTDGPGSLRELPLVVLVNEGSASASEILAGALHDQRKTKLVGKKTFGKGSVQQLFDLKDGSSLKITIAHWVLPNGFILDKKGIDPDVEVKLEDKDIEAGKDPQLDKAVEVLKQEIGSIAKPT